MEAGCHYEQIRVNQVGRITSVSGLGYFFPFLTEELRSQFRIDKFFSRQPFFVKCNLIGRHFRWKYSQRGFPGIYIPGIYILPHVCFTTVNSFFTTNLKCRFCLRFSRGTFTKITENLTCWVRKQCWKIANLPVPHLPYFKLSHKWIYILNLFQWVTFYFRFWHS